MSEIRFDYKISRDDFMADFKRLLVKNQGYLLGDINRGRFSALQHGIRIHGSYYFTHEWLYLEIVNKPDYVSLEIIEQSLQPFFEKGSLDLFKELLEEITKLEQESALA